MVKVAIIYWNGTVVIRNLKPLAGSDLVDSIGGPIACCQFGPEALCYFHAAAHQNVNALATRLGRQLGMEQDFIAGNAIITGDNKGQKDHVPQSIIDLIPQSHIHNGS